MKKTTKNAFIAISVMKKVMLTAILLFNTSCGREGLLEADGNSSRETRLSTDGSIRTDSEASINSSSSKSSIKSAASMAAKAFTWSYKSSGVVTSLCTKAVTSAYDWFSKAPSYGEEKFSFYDGPSLLNKEELENWNKKQRENRIKEQAKTEVVDTPHKVHDPFKLEDELDDLEDQSNSNQSLAQRYGLKFWE